MLEVLQQAWCRPPELLCSCLCLRLQSPFGKQPPLPHQLHQLSRAPSWPSCATVATPQTKPAISNNQRKVSSCCCLGALRPLLSSVLPSSVGVLHLTPWTRGEDMRGRVSQEEGRGGDAGGAQLGTERVSSLETPSCPGSAQAFRGNRSAPAAITNLLRSRYKQAGLALRPLSLDSRCPSPACALPSAPSVGLRV